MSEGVDDIDNLQEIDIVLNFYIIIFYNLIKRKPE